MLRPLTSCLALLDDIGKPGAAFVGVEPRLARGEDFSLDRSRHTDFLDQPLPQLAGFFNRFVPGKGGRHPGPDNHFDFIIPFEQPQGALAKQVDGGFLDELRLVQIQGFEKVENDGGLVSWAAIRWSSADPSRSRNAAIVLSRGRSPAGCCLPHRGLRLWPWAVESGSSLTIYNGPGLGHLKRVLG